MGCLKLRVVFRKIATKYRALLRKMTYKDKAPYNSTPLCSKLAFEDSTQPFFPKVRITFAQIRPPKMRLVELGWGGFDP